MKRIAVRFSFFAVIVALIYLLNVLTTNYIFNPSKASKLQLVVHDVQEPLEKRLPKQPSNGLDKEISVANVEILPHGQAQNEPLFRQDIEKYSFYNPSNSLSDGRRRIEDGLDPGLVEKSAKLRIPYKLVHLDLKGAPPKMAYIVNELFPLIKNVGANGILVEYEDTFPFHGNYLDKISNGAYTVEEIKWFIREAKTHDFEVVPLVQTFGHMEFILKKKAFKTLRENPLYPQSLCPKQNASWSLVTQLIDQVLALHGDANYVHIGCDEVYQIGQCPLCKNTDMKTLFVDHVSRVASYVKTKYKKNVIIWDDMLRKFYTNELMDSKIGTQVEVMMWDYTEDVERLIPNYLIEMYTSVFTHIWVASSYKGAFGEKLYNVNINRHALNHLSWLKTLATYESKIKNFRGFALTGWSRYDHFAVLCELLPVAIPSLILNLLILKHRHVRESIKALGVELKCDLINIELPIGHCQWPGDHLYNTLQELENLENHLKSLVGRVDSNGWISQWNVQKNYTNPSRLVQFYNDTASLKAMLEISRSKISKELDKFYQKSMRNQWLEMVVDPMLFKLTTILRDIMNLSKRTVWD